MSVPPRSLPAQLCAALAAAVIALVVATALWTPVEDLRDRSIVPDGAGSAPTVVPLSAVSQDKTVQRLTLQTAAAEAVVAVEEIDLPFASGAAPLDVVRGTLAVGGCIYATPDGTRVAPGVLVRFVRTTECNRIVSGPAAVWLTMRLSRAEPLVMWVWVLNASGVPPADALTVSDLATATAPRWVIPGRYVTFRAPSNTRRVDLLNYLWQLTPAPYWIGGVVAVAGVLMFAGTLICLRVIAGVGRQIWSGAGAGCVALAIGLLYSVLVPPFQAPDEPDHFLAFADLTGRHDLTEQAMTLARLGHFQRIKTRGDERFRPFDAGRPYPEAWDANVFAIPIAGRSRTTLALWTGVGAVTRGMRAPGVLLTLRLTNAVVLAAALGAGVALVAAQATTAAALSVALALLFVPTLPFFGTHVSDFAVLTSTYVLLGSVVAALFLDGPRSHWLGLPLGLTIALTLAGGRSGGPMAAFAAAVLAARAMLGTRDDVDGRQALGHAAVFWLGAATGMLLLVAATSDEYTRGLLPGDAGGIPPWFQSAAEAMRTHAWWFAALLPAGIGVELAGRALRLRLAHRLRGPRATIVAVVPALIGLAIVAIAIASLAIDLPVTHYLDVNARPPLRAYIGEQLATLLTSVRLRHPDLLLSIFFWGGFGWLDTILPSSLVTALVAAAGCLALWLLAAIRRAGDERRAVWLEWLAAGWLTAFTTTAVASYFVNRSLHGRYLMGVYLTCIAVIATAPAIGRAGGHGRPRLRPIACGVALVVCAGLHAFALSLILQRYF